MNLLRKAWQKFVAFMNEDLEAKWEAKRLERIKYEQMAARLREEDARLAHLHPKSARPFGRLSAATAPDYRHCDKTVFGFRSNPFVHLP
ncbi:MAG: hypothetical protein ACO1PI_04060 [Bacteroidota bacterium]